MNETPISIRCRMKKTLLKVVYCSAVLLGIAFELEVRPTLGEVIVNGKVIEGNVVKVVDGKVVEGTVVGDAVLEGSGTAACETRDVEEFKEISAGGSTRVDVTVGPEMSIQVTADDNILPHVKTDVTRERLKIYVDQSYSSKSAST